MTGRQVGGHIEGKCTKGCAGKCTVSGHRRWYPVTEERIDGKRKRTWHPGHATKREAQRALDVLKGRLRDGSYVDPSTLTVGAYLDQWLAGMPSQLKPSTWATYRDCVTRYLTPRIGTIALQGLTVSRCKALYADLLASGGRDGRQLSARTVQYAAAVLRKALNDALAESLILRNPAGPMGAKAPKVRRTQMQTWSAAELRTFLKTVADDRLHAAWLFAASTGARRGEILGLRWADLDLAAGQAAIRQARVLVRYEVAVGEPKSGKARLIALDPTLVAELHGHRARQLEERLAWAGAWTDTGYVFTREDGHPIHPDAFSKTFERHVKRAGLRPIRLHDLRHTHATLALQAGVNAKVVSTRLGHANIGITLDLYTHAIPELDAQAAVAVAALVSGA